MKKLLFILIMVILLFLGCSKKASLEESCISNIPDNSLTIVKDESDKKDWYDSTLTFFNTPSLAEWKPIDVRVGANDLMFSKVTVYADTVIIGNPKTVIIWREE